MIRWMPFAFLMTLLACLLNSVTPSLAAENWYDTGHLDGYPDSRYLTALGYGSTLHRARTDAARNLANQIDSDIQSKFEQSTSRTNLSISRSTNDTLTVRTHAKLYGLINIRGRFVQKQGSYVALVGVRREDLVKYLKGRIRSLEQTIFTLRGDLEQATGPIRRIHDLSGIVRAKEKAAFFDREVAVVSGSSPSDRFNSQKEISQIETLLSREMTVSVSVTNACGKVDSFASRVRESIEQEVNRLGLLVVPAGGKIKISGLVSASPMNAGFSRRYRFYMLQYALSMSAPNGAIWGSVVRSQKVAGLNSAQAEQLASRDVTRKGVGPLLAGLKSRLFLDKGDPKFVSFPSETNSKKSVELPKPPKDAHCGGF